MKRGGSLPHKRAKPRRNEGRVQHGRMKRKGKAPPTADEQRHLDRVGLLPCLKTGRRPVVVHHIMHMPGKRCRRDHRFVVPLIPEFHNMGDESVHSLGGEAQFKAKHKIDLVAEAVRLWEESNAR